MALIRTAALAALIYGGFLVAYPDHVGRLYHVLVPALIAGGVVGFWMLAKILDLSEGALKISLEAAFLIGVAAFVGSTLPQKSGKAPLTQFSQGARPNREAVRRGLKGLGINPDGGFGGAIASLFPKH